MTNPISGKTILLGVTGSIAAYKAADLASKLTQQGALVDTVLTKSAERFIAPLTFQSVTSRKAYTDENLWDGLGHVTHIGLGRAADLVLIAPISATTIAKLANGFGDNLLSVAVLASHAPLVIAPAMDAGMYAHPATQANVEVLRKRGAYIIGPAEGHLASGLVGPGRMVEPLEILSHARFVLSRGGPLAGKRIVVTAGGTQEAIDPVRFITNRSSGKQGYALAQAALDSGADVTLISAPTHLAAPAGVKLINVRSAAEMQAAVQAETATADALIMSAAVADFRPVHAAAGKIKKENGVPRLELEATTDILSEIGSRKVQTCFPRVTIGFAAESTDLVEHARIKLQSKQLDMIVANDISASDAGFDVETNRVVFLYSDGSKEESPLLPKTEIAEQVIQRLSSLLTRAG